MKKRFTKIISLLFAAVMTVGAVSAVSSAEVSAYDKTDETLTIMVASEPQSITSLTGLNDQVAVELEYAVGARVWELNMETLDIDYSLATGYEVIDDTHYRITLRDDAVFMDGTPVTAEDAVYCYQTYCDVGLDGTQTIDRDSFVVEDDTHFIIAFTKYTPGWYNALAEASFCIFSKAYIEENGGPEAFERELPMSAGRYFMAEWKPGEYMLFERNDAYWDPDYTGYYKYIKVLWTSDSASRLLAVKSGGVDVTGRLGVSEAITLETDPTATPVYFNTPTVFNLYFNCSSEGPLADVKVREALSYAINSEAMNMIINMGKGQAEQGFVPKGFKYYKEYFEGGVHPYDEAKAKELLAEAGYPDGFTLECMVLKNNLQIATMVQEMFRKVGVEMNVTSVEPATYLPESRAGHYDITVGTNANGYIKPDNFNLLGYNTRFEVIGGPKVNDPAIEDIIAKAQSPDEATAEEGWHEVIDYVFDNSLLVGLYSRIECAAMNPALEGLRTLKRDYLDYTMIHPIQ